MFKVLSFTCKNYRSVSIHSPCPGKCYTVKYKIIYICYLTLYLSQTSIQRTTEPISIAYMLPDASIPYHIIIFTLYFYLGFGVLSWIPQASLNHRGPDLLVPYHFFSRRLLLFIIRISTTHLRYLYCLVNIDISAESNSGWYEFESWKMMPIAYASVRPFRLIFITVGTDILVCIDCS